MNDTRNQLLEGITSEFECGDAWLTEDDWMALILGSVTKHTYRQAQQGKITHTEAQQTPRKSRKHSWSGATPSS